MVIIKQNQMCDVWLTDTVLSVVLLLKDTFFRKRDGSSVIFNTQTGGFDLCLNSEEKKQVYFLSTVSNHKFQSWWLAGL